MKIKFLICGLLVSGNILSQDTNPSRRERVSSINELKNIYTSLEYNTSSFNDLKEKWIIVDQKLNRNIFNQILAKNEFRFHDRIPNKDYIRILTEAVYNGNIVSNVTKRHFDNEVERFSFSFRDNNLQLINKLKGKLTSLIIETGNPVNNPEDVAETVKYNPEQYLPDPIIDGSHLTSIVGKEIYKDIKTKQLHVEVSKEEFILDQSYNFDIKLNFFNPELMF